MNRISVMVLCGPSARHVYFANALASTGRVIAIVQEAGTHWTAKKVLTTLRPGNFLRKVSRWIRDRKRYAAGKEAAYFFGDGEPMLLPGSRVLRVADINDPAVVRLADDLSPDLIAVFGPDIKYYQLFMDTVYGDDLKSSISFSEYFQRLNSLKTVYKNVYGVFCSGFIPDTKKHPALRYVRCPAGTTKLTVMPDGTVYPCYLFVRHDDFMIGNILNDDFNRIWTNPVLDLFRTFEKNSCINKKCELFSFCHGGCPAVSLLISGSINAPDPRCSPYR